MGKRCAIKQMNFLLIGESMEGTSILTTSTQTYKLRRNEFSNTYLLTEDPDNCINTEILSNFICLFFLITPCKAKKNYYLDFERIQPNKKHIYNILCTRCMIKEDSDLAQFIEEAGLSEEEVINTLQISIAEFEQVIPIILYIRFSLVRGRAECHQVGLKLFHSGSESRNNSLS